MSRRPAPTPLTDEQRETADANRGLVCRIARRYYKPGLDLDDLVQAGHFGLFNAVKKFDPARGYQFSTFAWKPICWAVIKESRRQVSQHLEAEFLSCVQPEDLTAATIDRRGVDACEAMQQEEQRQMLYDAMDYSLSDRQQGIMAQRLAGRKFTEIAAGEGVSKQRIQNIEATAVMRIVAKCAAIRNRALRRKLAGRVA